MKLTYVCIAVPLLLAGCASSRPIQGPSGGVAYFVKCGSAVIDACYEEAAKVCPRGYAVVDRQANPNGFAAPLAGGGFMMARGPNTMLVECKP